MKMTSRLAAAAVGALVLALAGCASQGPEQPSAAKAPPAAPASVIYIGNSFFYYNNSMHNVVGRMVREGMPEHKLRSSSVTISGSGLDWHDVDSYFRPNGIGKYTFAAGNKVVFNEIKGPLFEVAVMMDCSQCPVHPTLKASFVEYAKKHSETVRRHGGHPVLFMSWAYADKPEMTKELADAYTAAGRDNNAVVIPAGLAFARSIARRPDINLYVADKRHPSPEGTYLAAATVYATLFGKSPVGLKYDAGLKPGVALHLQQAAWDTVQEYAGGR